MSAPQPRRIEDRQQYSLQAKAKEWPCSCACSQACYCKFIDKIITVAESCIMDGLSGAASVVAVIDLSAKVASLLIQYSVAVKNAKRDIERLEKKVCNIKDVLREVKQLLNGRDKTLLSATYKLSDSLKECFLQLTELNKQLDPGKTRKARSWFSVRALQWPFTSKEVEMHVARLEQYEQTYILALQVDQT